MIERGEKILQTLPESERQGLTGTSWLNVLQPNGMSLAEALNRDDPGIDMVFFKLRAIEDMIFSKGRMVDHTLGLPITAECRRQQAARQAEADARLRDAEEARIRRLQSVAGKHLQSDSEAWLNTANRELDYKVPLDMAQAGERELDLALSVLDRESRRRREEEKHRRLLIDLRSQLESKVTDILGRAARSFLASPYPELDRKKPIDYCVSAQTMQVCLELAEKIRRARR